LQRDFCAWCDQKQFRGAWLLDAAQKNRFPFHPGTATRAAASFKMKDGSTHEIDLSKIAEHHFFN